jgi:type I restriction enzyme S subunit
MSEWKEYRIGDLLHLEYGKSLINYRGGEGKYEVFGTNGKIGLTDKYIYNEPSLIIGRKGAYREVHFTKKPFFVIDTAFYTRKKNDLTDTIFMYYWFKNVDINAMDSGSAIPSTSRDEVYELDINLPPLPEQTAIAEVLSSLDDKIDLLHRQNKTLEQLAETLFRQWFVHRPELAEGEEAEEGWENGKLDDVISIKGGTTPSTSNPEFWNGNIHWTSPRDLSNHNSVFLFDTERKITEKGLKEIGSGLLPIGTVLLSSRAPIGYLAITEIPLAINQGYIAIVCNKLVSNYFIYLWCKANMQDIENAGNGSVFQEISKSTFREMEIRIPSIEKLKMFDKEAGPIFQKIKSNSIQIRTLTQLRDSLLPKLMSGEVRVAY